MQSEQLQSLEEIANEDIDGHSETVVDENPNHLTRDGVESLADMFSTIFTTKFSSDEFDEINDRTCSPRIIIGAHRIFKPNIRLVCGN